MQANAIARAATGHATTPRLSVIVTNYNYARYLPVAIDSLLAQPEPIEIIVVDDCSTDKSRDIIKSYGDRIIPVLQPVNVGQGAGFNAGFALASGDLVLFLDADDFLLPGAASLIVDNYDPGLAACFYRMNYSDKDGSVYGVFPAAGIPFSVGNISPLLRARGRYNGTITSGIVFSRAALNNVMPMDPEAFRIGADGYLSTVVPLYGPVGAHEDVVSAYRLHSEQHSRPGPDSFVKRARWRLMHDKERYAALKEHSARLGLDVANDLGTQDALNLKERIVSLMFDPANHPFPEDRLGALIRKKRALSLSQGRGLYRYLRAGWWTLLLVLPERARNRLFLFEIDPASRPHWFTRLVRAVKRGR